MVAIQGEQRFIQREERRGLSFALALAVHGLLAAFLLISVQWRTQKVETVEVELWGAAPAPRVEQPQTVVPVPPRPVAQPVPPIPERAPDIVEEKVKPSKVPATEKPNVTLTPTPKATAVPTALPSKKPADRSDDLASILNAGLAERNKVVKPKVAPKNIEDFATQDGSGTGTATQGAGKGQSAAAQVSKDYESLVSRLIRSKLDYHAVANDGAKARIRVSFLPDGTIVNADIIKQLGNPVYADAARRAILSVQRLPARPDGKLFSGDARVWVMNFCADESVVECKIN